MEKLKEYAKSIPYAIEPYSKAIELLDFFIHRWATSSSALPSSSPLVSIRSLHMYASLDLPCGFQMQEVFHGYRQSGDAASKARVREATNTALKSLPGWPSPIWYLTMTILSGCDNVHFPSFHKRCSDLAHRQNLVGQLSGVQRNLCEHCKAHKIRMVTN